MDYYDPYSPAVDFSAPPVEAVFVDLPKFVPLVPRNFFDDALSGVIVIGFMAIVICLAVGVKEWYDEDKQANDSLGGHNE